MIHWTFLLAAGIFEIGWAISLKLTNGWTHLGYLALNVTLGLGAAFCLAQAMRSIPLATAYPIWKGTAILGVMAYEMFVDKQPFNAARALFATLIIVGIVGLKVSTSVPAGAPAN